MTAEALLDELARPACYPAGVREVHIVQTHLSVVCITDELVYKLKKAVTLPFVDFAALAARRRACRDEVTLNRRLCPDTYLGTAALRRIDGNLRFAAIGDDERDDDLDVAVVMRRLPQDRMLDVLVAAGAASADDLRALAALVARFHERAERSAAITATGHPDRLAAFAAANFDEIALQPDHGLPDALLRAVRDASRRAFDTVLPTLRARADHGRIVDGHGDLHARNVCMTSPPIIYDCIEFEPAFRCGDVATEVAFLAMDLRYRKAADLARAFVDAYVEHSGDRDLLTLLPVLCSYRAMVRGKVAALAAAEAELPAEDREHARSSALAHLRLAAAYLIERGRPRWIAVCGPPASGKSSLARALADHCQWPHVATDVVRKELAGLPPTGAAGAQHYTPEFSRRTYAAVQARARDLLATGHRAVLLDGNFPTVERRDAARAAAAAAGAEIAFVHVHVDADTAIARAWQRTHDPHSVSDADADVTRELHGRFVAPTSDERDIVTVDGTTATSHLADQTLVRLLA